MAKYFNTSGDAQFGTAPYGNMSVLRFDFKTDTSGKLDNTALAENDTVVLGELPGGFRLDDAQVFVVSAGATGKVNIGYEYKDGSEADASYFFAAQDLAAQARARASQAKWVTLQKDAYLTLTVAEHIGATQAECSVLVIGEMLGNR